MDHAAVAADVACVLHDLGPAVVAGHSMGGLHGLVAAAQRPDLVRGLVVEDMGVDFRGRDADAARAWFAAVPQPFPSLAAVREIFGAAGEYMGVRRGAGVVDTLMELNKR